MSCSANKLNLNQLQTMCNVYQNANDLNFKDDGIESVSISPRVIDRKSSNSNRFERRYNILSYDNKLNQISETQKYVQRIAIDSSTPKDINNTKDLCFKREAEVFKKSLDYLLGLQQNTPIQNQTLKHSVPNIILLDVFVWENQKVNIEKGKFVFHTVCLWQEKSNEITLIDPSKLSFSYNTIKNHFEKYKIKNNNNQIVLNFEKFGNLSPSNFEEKIVFYKGDINPSREDGTPRDCIDIAVKIAFILSTYHPTNKNRDAIIEELKKLSNIASLSPILKKILNSKGSTCFLRNIQSSIAEIREATYQQFQENIKIFNHISINNFYEMIHVLENKQEIINMFETPQSPFAILKQISGVQWKELLKVSQQIKEITTNLANFNFSIQIKAEAPKKSSEEPQDADNEEPQDTDNEDINWKNFKNAISNPRYFSNVDELLATCVKAIKPRDLIKYIFKCDKHGNNILHLVAMKGSDRIFSSLYKKVKLSSADNQHPINAINKSNQSVLFQAVQSGSPKMVQSVLDQLTIENINKHLELQSNSVGETIFHRAVVVTNHLLTLKHAQNTVVSFVEEELCLSLNNDVFYEQNANVNYLLWKILQQISPEIQLSHLNKTVNEIKKKYGCKYFKFFKTKMYPKSISFTGIETFQESLLKIFKNSCAELNEDLFLQNHKNITEILFEKLTPQTSTILFKNIEGGDPVLHFIIQDCRRYNLSFAEGKYKSKAEKEAKDKAEKEAKDKAEKEAKEKAEKEVKSMLTLALKCLGSNLSQAYNALNESGDTILHTLGKTNSPSMFMELFDLLIKYNLESKILFEQNKLGNTVFHELVLRTSWDSQDIVEALNKLLDFLTSNDKKEEVLFKRNNKDYTIFESIILNTKIDQEKAKLIFQGIASKLCAEIKNNIHSYLTKNNYTAFKIDLKRSPNEINSIIEDILH
ncbi:MAG: hypothetical protein QRY71_06020 [Candidatus Rhabdochlamydia sp.]